MPNWVYNNLSVSGKTEDLLAFAEKASRRHETLWLTDKWKRNEDGTNTEVPESERKIEVELSEENPLSFWNFVAPTDEEKPYYFGHKTKAEDEDDPDATADERMAKALTFSGSGWYDWNIRNWGVKWDAGDAELDTDLSELDGTINNTISYRFQTAWGIPIEAITAMVRQHRELDFDLSSEEEQGWGAEFTSSDADDELDERSLITTDEWSIPESHEDFAKRGNVDGCICSHEEDEEEWYDDCPRSEKDYFVVVTKTYRVTASNEENAYNLATDNDPEEQMELIEDETKIFIADENGKRIYPTFGNGSLLSEPDEITTDGEDE
jgi:hypothetical protein